MATTMPTLPQLIFLFVIASAFATALSRTEDRLKASVNIGEVNIGEVDVVSLTATTYRKFLNQIRDQVVETCSFKVPILPIAKKTTKPEVFDVPLKADAVTLKVKLRQDNLYVIGYQMKDGTWLELGKKGQDHIITGSVFLELGENYNDLEKASSVKMTDLLLNKKELSNTVVELSDTTVLEKRAKGMLSLCLMIAEATRFADIENRIANGLLVSNNKLLPYMVDILMRNWKDYSTRVIKADADPTTFVRPMVDKDGKKRPDTHSELRDRFGIMYRRRELPPPNPLPPVTCKSKLLFPQDPKVHLLVAQA